MIMRFKHILVILGATLFIFCMSAIHAQNASSGQTEADAQAAESSVEALGSKKPTTGKVKTEKTLPSLGKSPRAKVSTKNTGKTKKNKQSKSDSSEHVISLESTITGDKEQPAVSYFIPWQKVGTPDKLRWNMDQKHDDSLTPVDRDVMVRSMKIYQQMNIENPIGH